MPLGAIKGPDAESVWARAKGVVSKEYPGLERKDPDRFYATVMTVYKSMCSSGPNRCSPVKESLSEMLGRMEARSGGSIEYWGLYVGDDDESAKEAASVASGLNKAMDAAKREIARLSKGKEYDERLWAEILSSVYSKHIAPVIGRHDIAGSSETMYVAAQGLIDTVKSIYGISGMTDLGRLIGR